MPIEIKGQWHAQVWDAAVDQLDAYYAVEWRAEGQGLYIVLWFGHVSGHQLPRHPEGLGRPRTPQELRQMLVERPPETVYERAWTKYLARPDWESNPANRAAMGPRRRMPNDREDWKRMRGAVWSDVKRRAQGFDE